MLGIKTSVSLPSVSFADCPRNQDKYVVTQSERGREVVAWLKVRLESLSEWKPIQSDGEGCADVKCLDYLNSNIPGNAIQINRLEDKLLAYHYEAAKKRKLLNRRGCRSQRDTFLQSYKVFSIFDEDIVPIESLDARIEQVQLELSEWKKRFRDLENEKAALFTAMAEEIEKSKSSAKCETDMVMKENEDMKKKIQKLEQSPPDYARTTPIPQLKSKQAQN